MLEAKNAKSNVILMFIKKAVLPSHSCTSQHRFVQTIVVIEDKVTVSTKDI